MDGGKRIRLTALAAGVVWLVFMGMLGWRHYIDRDEQELGYFARNIEFESETTHYYDIHAGNQKVGYMTTREIPYENTVIYREDSALKVNLAGMSREIFIQTSVGIDSTTFASRFLEFVLHSGSHTYYCSGIARNDSLFIEVKANNFSPVRAGYFTIHGTTTFPTTLPYYMHNSETDIMSIEVFDPVAFNIYLVNIAREGSETIAVGNRAVPATRYTLRCLDREATMWLDPDGYIAAVEGPYFFSGLLGAMDVRRTRDREVFLLPLETELGLERLQNTRFVMEPPLRDPRDIDHLQVQINGIRAANIDVTGSNKEILSVNPVVFGIHSGPVVDREEALEVMADAANDTTLLATTDYIQPRDARIRRRAEAITAAATDTLAMAYALNQWVHDTMRKQEGLHIVRSIDILREQRGWCDEHTKLFTALARSVGIPTAVKAGLVYRDGAFRYHSWPSVLHRGVWHDVDPFFGQDAADATHISLIRGGFEQHIDLLRITGMITLTVHAYR